MSLKTDEVRNKLSKIKAFLFDLQGVLIRENADYKTAPDDLIEMMKEFSNFCAEHNLIFGIITGMNEGEILKAVSAIRNIEVVNSSVDKVSAALQISEKYDFPIDLIFFMGDGVLDVPLLAKVGLSAAPESAGRRIKKAADFVCPGDTGAERLNFILGMLKNATGDG